MIVSVSVSVNVSVSETTIIASEIAGMTTTIDSRHTETLETGILATCETRETHIFVKEKGIIETLVTGTFVTREMYAMSETVTQETCVILAI